MKRYFIELAYNGAGFHGWQIQPNGITIQEELNKALTTLLQEDIYVIGAGRTDTGVHASFYVAHFETDKEFCVEDFNLDHLVYKLNRILSRNIAIYKIYPVVENMHARFSAVSRTYKYYIDKRKNPFTHTFAWKMHPLPDIALMNEAAKILFDYTDFTSFSKLHTDVNNNNCTLMQAYWEETSEQLIFTIKANRFLRNMVRAIVGTLVEVGQQRISINEFRQIIESKNRCKAGSSVPANALFLTKIEY